MKMTKKIALNVALSNCAAENYVYNGETVSGAEIRDTLTKMVEQLSKERAISPEAAAKRKEKTAAERAEYEAKFTPIVTAALPTTADEAKTLTDIAAAVPDLTEGKIRVLLGKIAGVEKVEKRGARNLYWYKG